MIDDYILDKDYLLYLKNKKGKNEYLKLYKNLYNLINSNEYNVLLNEYNSFINDVYKLFLELKINTSLEVALFYNKLLFEGVFSSNYKFSLNDPVKYDLLVKTWGSRVCTGNSVCRHNVMFLVDLERKFNNKVEDSTNIFDYQETLSLFNINKEYIISLINNLDELYQTNNYLINEFHLDNSKKIRKIKYLNDEIVGKQNIFK